MSDNVVYRLFPEPIFKYKLKNFEDLNKGLNEIKRVLKKDSIPNSCKGRGT